MLRARSLLAVALFTLVLAAPASASVLPGPMRDAVDTYAAGFAAYQEWTYVDRDALTAHGDYKRAYFTLSFLVPQKNKDVEVAMEVEARVVKCGPGWYVVSTPTDQRACRPRAWVW